MKEFIKQLLGDRLIFSLRSMKNRIYPTALYRQELLAEERCRNLYSKFVKRGDLCFDVGANLGNKVTPLLSLNARVIAVEPQKSCQEILKQKFGNRITIVPKGLGEKEEVKEFYVSNASTISSFSKDWIDEVSKERFKDYNWNKVELVEITTLDKLISTYGVPVFIKIDVEGYELEVLKGLTKAVGLISFEYTVPEQTKKAVDCISRIQSINSAIECNYSVGDSMEFELKNWEGPGRMIEIIKSSEFINSGFGDIYVKSTLVTRK